jgi:hypothetical protein
MPGDPNDCRENAKLCFELALSARTRVDQERLENIAHRWVALARDYEAANALLLEWGANPVANQLADAYPLTAPAKRSAAA